MLDFSLSTKKLVTMNELSMRMDYAVGRATPCRDSQPYPASWQLNSRRTHLLIKHYISVATLIQNFCKTNSQKYPSALFTRQGNSRQLRLWKLQNYKTMKNTKTILISN